MKHPSDIFKENLTKSEEPYDKTIGHLKVI